MLIAGLIQTLLAALGAPGWPCPVLCGLGIPCPGCGLSRATAILLGGEWSRALGIHPFAPAVVLFLALLGCAVLAPKAWRESLVNSVTAAERRTGVAVFLMLALVAHWAVRIVQVSRA